MYTSGPLCIHFRKSDGGQREQTAVGLLVLWVYQEEGAARCSHCHMGEDVHVWCQFSEHPSFPNRLNWIQGTDQDRAGPLSQFLDHFPCLWRLSIIYVWYLRRRPTWGCETKTAFFLPLSLLPTLFLYVKSQHQIYRHSTATYWSTIILLIKSSQIKSMFLNNWIQVWSS